MCYSKAYFKHDITIPDREWFVGNNALYSDKKNKRLPLVFIAPIYVPFENQLVQLDEKTRFQKNKYCAKFLFPINWREGGGGFAGGSMEKNDKNPEFAIQRELKEELGIELNIQKEDAVMSSIDNKGTVSIIYCKITHDIEEFDNWASKWIYASGINEDCEIEGVRRFSIDYEYYPNKKEGIIQGLPKKLWKEGGCLDKYWDNVAREQLLLLLLRLEIVSPVEMREIGECAKYFDENANIDYIFNILNNINYIK